MKKMMISIVGFVLCAVSVQAGAIQWGVSQLKVPANGITGGGLNNGLALQNAVAYLFVGTAPSDLNSVKSSVDAGTFDTASALKSGTSGSTGSITGANAGSYLSQVVTAYVVVFTTAYTGAAWTGSFLVSSSITKTFGTTGNQTYSFAFNTTSSTWTAVPEPTSMALLALGIAAVGLRRRFTK